MGEVVHGDEETWAPFPPNITAVVHQRRDPQGGPVTSTPDREGRSPTSPYSPCRRVAKYEALEGGLVYTGSNMTCSPRANRQYPAPDGFVWLRTGVRQNA
jgi:hypothetical protein